MDKQYFLNKLARDRPSVFKTYNYDLLPATFFAHDKIAVECYEHGVFYQKACSHLFSAGCPECGQQKTIKAGTLTTEQFILKSQSKFIGKFSYSKTVYTKKGVDLTVTCSVHGDIAIKPEWHFWSSHGCPKCDYEIPRAIKRKKILEKASLIHKNRYDYSNVVFSNVSDKVEITCPDHGTFRQSLFHHSNGIKCPRCAIKAGKTTLEDFISRAKTIHGDRYDYSKVEYLDNMSNITITCPKHGDFNQRPGSHLNGCRCKECYIEDSWRATEEFISNAKQIHGNKYDYSKVKYIGSKKAVEIICPTHGSFWQKPNIHVSSKNGCRLCSDSKGERAVELVLLKYGIEYIREYRLLPFRLRSDFYLPGFDIHIEFNGQQHYHAVEMFGGERALAKVQQNDRLKKEIIAKSGGSLVIVTYRTLANNSVEIELLRGLKSVYRYWFVVDTKIQAFHKPSDVCRAFGLSTGIRMKDLVTEAIRLIKGLSVLF